MPKLYSSRLGLIEKTAAKIDPSTSYNPPPPSLVSNLQTNPILPRRQNRRIRLPIPRPRLHLIKHHIHHPISLHIPTPRHQNPFHRRRPRPPQPPRKQQPPLDQIPIRNLPPLAVPESVPHPLVAPARHASECVFGVRADADVHVYTRVHLQGFPLCLFEREEYGVQFGSLVRGRGRGWEAVGPDCEAAVFVPHDYGGCCDGVGLAVAAAAAVGVEIHGVGHGEGGGCWVSGCGRKVVVMGWMNFSCGILSG